MSANVHSNTNPEELSRRLEANGPIGFITAVYETLKTLDRPYFYSAAVPNWLRANKDESLDADYQAAYNTFYKEGQSEKAFQRVPHCIIHQYRQYPAKRRYAGTSDSPTGARRQKTPTDVIFHERPLPETDEGFQGANTNYALRTNDRNSPPLWDSVEQIPDIIRPHVDTDTICYVLPWEYDVFVDFTLVAANMYVLEQMHKDLMLILRTFHDRSHTGASNLSGWFYQSVSGAPPDISNQIRGDFPARTITWRLKQVEAYAFPSKVLKEIHLRLYGDNT